jgi:CheY-like chemotaxis protein
VGLGATFSVEIPLMRGVGSAAAPMLQDSQHTGLSVRSLEGIRVLVVDDDMDSRDLMTHLLEQAGATVTTVGSAAEALEMIDALAPDVLVSDIGMPEQDGYTLLRTLRKRDTAAASIPAVAVTAYARPEDRAHAIDAGFQVHVSKPIAPRDLIANVEHLAGIKRTRT